MRHKIKINEVRSFEYVLAASYQGTRSKELIAKLVNFETSKELVFEIKKNSMLVGSTPSLVKALEFYNEQ